MLLVAVVSAAVAYALMEFRVWRAPYEEQQRRMVERVLASDPEVLLNAGRQIIAHHSGFIGEINPTSPAIPPALRRLKPTYVHITSSSVSVDFSDVFNPFGIEVFPAGKIGRGRLKWIDGLWLYDDGQLEDLREQLATKSPGRPLELGPNRAGSRLGSGR